MHVRAKSSGVAHGTDKAGKCPTIAWGVEGAVVGGGMGKPVIHWWINSVVSGLHASGIMPRGPRFKFFYPPIGQLM